MHHDFPILIYSGITIIAFLVGILLTIIIQCYPKLLERGWRRECLEFLELPREATVFYNFFSPLSSCEKCHQAFGFWDSVPVINYIRCKGHCRHCQKSLALWPLLTVALTIFGSICLYAIFGETLRTVFLLLLTYALIVLAFIDYREQFLPDDITFTFLWVGLILNSLNLLFTTASDAIFGAALGYLVLRFISFVLSFIRKGPGVGYGDMKMIALVGAWVGATNLFFPLALTMSLQFIVLRVVSLITTQVNPLFTTRLQLGPALSLAMFITLWRMA